MTMSYFVAMESFEKLQKLRLASGFKAKSLQAGKPVSRFSPLPLLLLGLFLASPLLPAGQLSAQYTLKYATLAPEGTVWTKYIKLMKEEIAEKTDNEVELKLYLGGVAGDEKTMVRKLKAGLIDIAAFSGQGLGEIVPESRILELPMFFKDYGEVDAVVNELYGEFSELFQKEGYLVGGWGEAGFVYLYTRKVVRSAEEMKGVRIWAPAGDPIVTDMFKRYGFVPTYLGIESVLPQLQTGGLEAVYAPPLAAIGLQWFHEVDYIVDLKLSCATGATLINEAKLSKLPEEYRQIVIDVSTKYSRQMVLELREKNLEAMEVMRSKGIEIIAMDKSEIAEMQKKSIEVYLELTGEMYPKELLERALMARDRSRKK